jgi:hypothetical protein
LTRAGLAARAATDAPAAFKCPVASLLKTVTVIRPTRITVSKSVFNTDPMSERERVPVTSQKDRERTREREQETRETQGERQRPARVQGRSLQGWRGACGTVAVVVSCGELWALLGAMPGGEREGE